MGTQKLSFITTGEEITKQVREAFINYDYLKSFEILDSLGMQEEHVKLMLLGGMILEGETTETNSTIYGNDENMNSEKSKKYQEKIHQAYSGIYLENNTLYRPSRYIKDFGKKDIPLKENETNIDLNKTEDKLERAKFYMNSNEIAKELELSIELDGTVYKASYVCVFKPISFKIPSWLKTFENPQDALTDFNKDKNITLYVDGYLHRFKKPTTEELVSSHGYYIPDPLLKMEYQKKFNEKVIRMRKEIQEKANSKRGYYEIINPNDKTEIYKIPKTPFDIATLEFEDEENDSQKIKILKLEWGLPISDPSMKMRNDNMYHTDWVIGAGINPTEFYDKLENNKWFAEAINNLERDIVQEIDTNIEQNYTFFTKVLSLNNQMKESLFVQPKFISNNTNPGDTLLLNTSEEIFLKELLEVSKGWNGLIVTQNGSQTAHLINNAKELKANVIYSPDVEKLFKIPNLTEKDQLIYEFNPQLHSMKLIAKSPYIKPLIQSKDIKNKKTANLAKLKKAGLYVQDGFHLDIRNLTKEKLLESFELFNFNDSLVFRSAGEGEGENNSKFSGVFKSVFVEYLHSEDLNSNKEKTEQALSEVYDSFYSDISKELAARLNVDVPRPGILVQKELKWAKHSAVCQISKDKKRIVIDFSNENCQHIISGKAQDLISFKTENYSEEELKNILEEKSKDIINSKLVETLFNCVDVLKEDLEIEASFKNGRWCIFQAI